MAHDPLEHVMDEKGQWTFFTDAFGGVQIKLGEIFGRPITKFMIMELIAAILMIAIFVPLCRRAAKGGVPKGPWWNAFEGLLTFIRDEVARPTLGGHDDHHEHEQGNGHGHESLAAKIRPEDAYVPFLWTMFLFILFCNLLGMLPFMGSPTASVYVTGALAVVAFIMMHAAAIAKMGPVHYVKSLWPAMDVPFGMGYVIKPMIFFIEFLGTFIKGFVLAVRLFANMFAGHAVLATILGFIQMAANASVFLWGGVTVASVLGVTALSLLELFVAFLQAYVFTFLTALFMVMALYPSH